MSRRIGDRAAAQGAAGAPALDMGATLGRLRLSLRDATRFMVPWGQFHDEVAMVPAFTYASQPARNPRLEGALEAVAEKLVGRRHKMDDPVFLCLKEHGFWHGSCVIGPRTLIFFYFDESDSGLTGVFRKVTDDDVELVRFSLVDVPPGTTPVRGERGQA